MIEQIKYINHEREIISFGHDGLFANYNDLRNYSWNFDARAGRIYKFKKEIVKKRLPILALKDHLTADGKNRIFEIFEKDIIAKKYGKLYIGDYYLNCYITSSVKGEYLLSEWYLPLELEVVTDRPNWIKETTTAFRLAEAAQSGGQNLDYLFDFPFDYKSDDLIRNLKNDAFSTADFKMVIFGSCENPAIYIGDHLYSLNLTIDAGEYVTIDSAKKTIEHTKNGQVFNVFNSRNRDSYIFEKIRPQRNNVSWAGEYSFNVTIFEERSEPKWI